MEILNNASVHRYSDGRYQLVLCREKLIDHYLDMYFIINCGEEVKALKAKAYEYAYNTDIEDDELLGVIEKDFLHIEHGGYVGISSLDTINNDPEEYRLSFEITTETENINASCRLKRQELNFIEYSTDIPVLNRKGQICTLETDSYPLKQAGMSEKFELALKTAVDYHRGQMRKGTNIPYIFHPMETAMILAQNNFTGPIVIAGILHDTIEDTELTEDKIMELFGDDVLRLVLGASESNREVPGITWKQRKQHTIDSLKDCRDISILLVSCADKLSNIRSIYRDYTEVGDKLWSRFNEGYREQKWYYQSLVVSLKGISEYKIYGEFYETVRKVFGSLPVSWFIKYDMESIAGARIDQGIDYVRSTLTADYHVLQDTVPIIREFEMLDDEGLSPELREAMVQMIELCDKTPDSKDLENYQDVLVNAVKVYFILVDYINFNLKWVKKISGEGILDWYMFYDED